MELERQQHKPHTTYIRISYRQLNLTLTSLSLQYTYCLHSCSIMDPSVFTVGMHFQTDTTVIFIYYSVINHILLPCNVTSSIHTLFYVNLSITQHTYKIPPSVLRFPYYLCYPCFACILAFDRLSKSIYMTSQQ